MRLIVCCALFTVLLISICPLEASAWNDTESHRKITQSAINSFDIVQLDEFFRSVFNIEGLRFTLTNDGPRLDRLILDGSEFEDEKTDDFFSARGLNHFHDPTRSDGSLGGLHEVGVVGNSAAVWAEDHLDNMWDYRSFKDYFKEALTSRTSEEREQGLANMMRALGQVMHLMEDMAVPAHTRNGLIGGHTSDTVPGWPPVASIIENYLKQRPEMIRSASSVDKVSFPTFRDYFDADVYTDASPYPVYGKHVGLSEYSNSFFVSRDTRFTTSMEYTDNPYDVFPHPALEEVRYWFEEKDGSMVYPWNATLSQLLFWKFYGGIMSADNRERVDHLVCGYYFLKYLTRPNKRWALERDETCLDEYLSKLVPKAVAYAASLAAYMTRGRIDLDYDAGSERLLITNSSAGDMEGLFSLFYDNDDGDRVSLPAGPWYLSIAAGETIESPVSVVFPRNIGIQRSLVLLFEGRIGEEFDAVAGVTRTLAPYDFTVLQVASYLSFDYPTPIDSWGTVYDDPYTLIRRQSEQFWLTNELTDHTLSRRTKFFLQMETTPDICKKLRLDCEIWPYPVSVRIDTREGDRDSGIVSLCMIETSPGEWVTLFDAIHEVPGELNFLSTPFSYLEGIYQVDPQFIIDFNSVPSYINRLDTVDRMCNPWETVGSHPHVDIHIRYHWDEATEGFLPECPDAEFIFQQARSYHPIYAALYQEAYKRLQPVQALLHNNEWEKYGFLISLNRLEPSAADRSFVLYDGPVTFHKPYGSDKLFVY